MRIVVFATAWGTAFGGINAFNRDFCVALAKALADRGEIYCAVINADRDVFDLAEVRARRDGVTLIPIDRESAAECDPSCALDVRLWLERQTGTPEVDVWVGHDV